MSSKQWLKGRRSERALRIGTAGKLPFQFRLELLERYEQLLKDPVASGQAKQMVCMEKHVTMKQLVGVLSWRKHVDAAPQRIKDAGALREVRERLRDSSYESVGLALEEPEMYKPGVVGLRFLTGIGELAPEQGTTVNQIFANVPEQFKEIFFPPKTLPEKT